MPYVIFLYQWTLLLLFTFINFLPIFPVLILQMSYLQKGQYLHLHPIFSVSLVLNTKIHEVK